MYQVKTLTYPMCRWPLPQIVAEVAERSEVLMAIWQFDLDMVAGLQRGHLPPLLTTQAVCALSDGFGASWQMLPDWLVYGEENGNRIDLVLCDEGGAEITARVDARSDADRFLRRLCGFAADLDCKLYSPELDKFVDGTMCALNEALQASQAWQFALDPRRCMWRIQQQGQRPQF